MKNCDVCRNHDNCRLEHKDNIEKCCFVVFTEEYSISQTKEYKQGYNKAVDDALEKVAKAICIGCGYLDGVKCTYKGGNCGVRKPMLETVTEALEQMKNNDLVEEIGC